MPILQLTDGPLFSAGPGTLSTLTNMEIRPGGYAEARGGFEKDKPNGGTAVDAISAGGYSDALQLSTSYGWVRTYDNSAGAGSQYSGNLQLHEGAWLFAGSGPIALNDAIYFGADLPFSRIALSLSVAGAWTSITLIYEYLRADTTAGTLTTAETIDFTALRTLQFASWTMPTDWGACSIGDSGTGNVQKYWMRIRVSAINLPTNTPRIAYSKGYWSGMRELYVCSQSPRTSATAGTLKRHGQSSTTREWFSINSAMYSGNASPVRMAEYRGRVIMVNGKETKRWDGANFSDLGNTAFANTINVVNEAGGVLGAGVWRYYAAWGNGPCENTDSYADRQDVRALYGPGRATYLSEVTTLAAQRVRMEMTSGPPAGVSSLYIYRTDDLTNVPAGDRGNAPAYLIQSFRLVDNLTTEPPTAPLGVVGNYYRDDNLAFAFPLQEAYTFDISPPQRCKYLLIYQNRLFLGDDETWYISDPFFPDRFSTKATTGYIKLARAQGGRHMGGAEFADQAVLWTEDQTWGLTNVDLDVPQLFPIALGVGCVAPDAIAVTDGELIWPARDGFYKWDGGRQGARKISGKMKETFGKLSFENHGGSKATGHNRRYDVRLSSPDYSTIGNAYRFNLDSGEWASLGPTGFASTLFPLVTIYAPLGNNDAGAIHPLWGKVDYGTGAGEYNLFLGELTTQDNGTNYTCSATMHFPLRPGLLLTPTRVKAYYQATNGWQTPSFTFTVADVLGSAVGSLNTGTPDTGDDYNIIGGTFTAVGRGSSDLQVRFSVTSQASGTVNGQRLFGALLEGQESGVRRGGI